MKLTLQWHACDVLEEYGHLRLNDLDGGPCDLCLLQGCYKSFSHSGPEDRNVTWAPALQQRPWTVLFPIHLLPQGFPGPCVSEGTSLTPSFVTQWHLMTSNLSPGPADQHALRAYVYVVGTVPRALMQRWQGSHFCARGAQSGEGTDIVTCGYSDGLRTVRVFFREQLEWARASGMPHRGDGKMS